MYATIGWGQAVSPFYGGCPLLRVSIIGGSTEHTIRTGTTVSPEHDPHTVHTCMYILVSTIHTFRGLVTPSGLSTRVTMGSSPMSCTGLTTALLSTGLRFGRPGRWEGKFAAPEYTQCVMIVQMEYCVYSKLCTCTLVFTCIYIQCQSLKSSYNNLAYIIIYTSMA